MFYSIAIMLIFLVVLLVFEPRSRYSWMFAIMALGAVIAFFFMILQISIFADYGTYPSQEILYRIDRQIYRFVTRRFSIPFKLNVRLINLGISVYLVGVTLFSIETERSVRHSRELRRSSKHRWVYLYLLLPILSIVVTDPMISTRMYFVYHTSSCREVVYTLFRLLEITYKLIIAAALFWPSVMLMLEARKLSVTFLQKRIRMLAIGMALANIMFFSFFFLGACGISVDQVVRSGFWIFETVNGVIPVAYMNSSTLVFLVIAAMGFILLSCQLDLLMTPLTEKKIRRNIVALNEAIGENLHSQKNLFFSMQILTEKIMRHPEAAAIPEAERLQRLVNVSLDRVTEMLNNLKNIDCQYYQRDLLGVIDQAVRAANIPESIHVSWERERYSEAQYQGTYDGYCLEQALVNILNNAVEAIQIAGREKGRITVSLTGFFRWSVLCITDNGCGILRKDKASIFEPHYSGKKGKMNWGLGLPYAYRVVKAHLGQIRIESKSNVYTSVIILLPADSAGRTGRDRRKHAKPAKGGRQ